MPTTTDLKPWDLAKRAWEWHKRLSVESPDVTWNILLCLDCSKFETDITEDWTQDDLVQALCAIVADYTLWSHFRRAGKLWQCSWPENAYAGIPDWFLKGLTGPEEAGK